MEIRSNSRLLPVAIMAHNEEKVIGRAVESVLCQSNPEGYLVKAIVVANGCTDRTEDIVRQMRESYPDRVELLSIREKGKTRALNEAINLFVKRISNEFEITYVIFLDADCEFLGTEALVNFVKGFGDKPLVCAISANCVPDVCFNGRKDIIAEVYRAVHSLGVLVENNSISGMCYGIRFDVMKKIEFPEFQFAEDMYVSSRLDGHFYRDRKINIVFKTPNNLRREIKRRTRQEISTQRYREYYSYLKKKGVKVELFENPLGEELRWKSIGDSRFKAWLNLAGIKLKFFAIIYVLIRILAKIMSYKALLSAKRKGNFDHWTVMR